MLKRDNKTPGAGERPYLRGMTAVAKTLFQVEEFIWDQMYPGYPFTLFILIDFKNKKAILDNKKYDLETFGHELGYIVARNGLSCSELTYGTWLTPSKWGDPSKILQDDFDTIDIDHHRLVKLWFAVTSAVHKYQGQDKYLVATINDECEYVSFDILDDPTVDDAQKFVNNYCTGDPNTKYDPENA